MIIKYIKQKWIVFSIIIGIILIILLIIFIFRRPHRNPDYEYFYNDNKDKHYEDSKYSDEITINLNNSHNSIYKICAYGARALKGGKGCALCGKFKIKEPLSITYQLGGREAGGKGGEDCGEYYTKDGSRGAGAAIIMHNGEYLIVAGGGGGNSESEIINGKEKVINRGGNCGKDGEGKLGGKKGGNDEGRKSGGKGESGISLHGGNGASSSDHGMYCGGGGGDGWYGGGAGGYGNKGDNGGGGAGSNYYNRKYCKNIEIFVSSQDYSGIRIYRYELR